MHEASIALSIIEIAEDHCKKAGYDIIQSIEVKIGVASGILPDALYMAFDIVKLETMANDAKLIVDKISLGGTCNSCKEPFTTDEQFMLNCPTCSSNDFIFETGREMEIKEIEVD